MTQVKGLGPVHFINAKWNIPGQPAGNVWMKDKDVVVADRGRTYWGWHCNKKGPGQFKQSDYVNLHLLGKRLEYTTNVNGAGCGCNAAFYLIALTHSPWMSHCEDYYCDAMNICGIKCVEIDLQEANMFAYHTTFHDLKLQWAPDLGTGGGGPRWKGPRDFTGHQYGIHGTCINTKKKFRVSIEFPVHEGTQELKSIDLKLSQNGCSVRASGAKYKEVLPALSVALKHGMTPVMSYWRDWSMTWLDGDGPNETTFCKPQNDAAPHCSNTVAFSDFSVSSLSSHESD